MSEGIKVYRTFMHGIRIYNNEELISKVPYTKNGNEFIDEISNLIAVEIIDNVRYGDIPKASESGLDLRFVSVSLPFTYETLPQQIREKMSNRHEHAELLDPEEICYKESDVIDIINMIYGNELQRSVFVLNFNRLNKEK